ncbi:MAG TPA: hypothetical protein VM346_07345 [Sphingomicrobium sp.]|nr:hypothetical protein [Sphingomicrobium sp.]
MTISHQVPAGYRHYAKQATPLGTLAGGARTLKLYHLAPGDRPVPENVAAAARRLLEDEFSSAGRADDDQGFAIVHRCGESFHFLLVTVWRGANEAWEAVWYVDEGMDAFAPFQPAYPPEAGSFRPTYCVWELGIVASESAAWTRYLQSPRGEGDLARWRSDLFAAAV